MCLTCWTHCLKMSTVSSWTVEELKFDQHCGCFINIGVCTPLIPDGVSGTSQKKVVNLVGVTVITTSTITTEVRKSFPSLKWHFGSYLSLMAYFWDYSNYNIFTSIYHWIYKKIIFLFRNISNSPIPNSLQIPTHFLLGPK